MLLLFHASSYVESDLLRSINRDLGHPINTITGCSRIVNDVLREQSLAEGTRTTLFRQGVCEGLYHCLLLCVHGTGRECALTLLQDSSLSNRIVVFCQSVTFKTKLWALGLYMWLRSCWTGNYDDF